LSYRLLAGAENDIDRILLWSARIWDIEAAERYDLLMRAVFAHIGANPALPGAQAIAGMEGIQAYPLRLGRSLVDRQHRVGHPRHIVVYRLGSDRIVEIIGLAHDRMLLNKAARRMQQDVDGRPV
jgi:toxin ParE1/3/4